MHDQPSVSELVQAVKNFVDETAMPQLEGRAGFHARVASNVLATILRDLEARTDNDEQEKTRLLRLLKNEAVSEDLSELNSQLQEKIRSGDFGIDSVPLMEHLKKTAIAQLKVDQPNYSALATALRE